VFSIEQLEEELNFRCVPSHAASALLGEGVFDTLRSASEGVLRKLASKLETSQDLARPEGDGGRRR
jgi:hypothetical protein